jgi:septum formation topological specificity factor MinE
MMGWLRHRSVARQKDAREPERLRELRVEILRIIQSYSAGVTTVIRSFHAVDHC